MKCRFVSIGLCLTVFMATGFSLALRAGSPFVEDAIQPSQGASSGQISSGSGDFGALTPQPLTNAKAQSSSSPKIAPELLPPPSAGKKGITAGSKSFPKWFDGAVGRAKNWNFPTLVNKYGKTISQKDFFKAIIWIESNGIMKHTNGAMVRSRVGAIGFAQLMPRTARSVKVNPNDPEQNLKGGVFLLNDIFQVPAVKHARGEEKLIKAVVAYNAGPYSRLLKKPWTKLRLGKSREPIGYGLKLKMCLGLQLDRTERKLVSKIFRVKATKVDALAANGFYSPANGLR